ncbi:hypothetical protein CN138_35260 [Sinorhizobium meliloti]|nr:hypothetical protein CN233_07965 [Sinorhizobium meliloti]RVK86015.1 hypothetical protein CN152_34740 [Sinorhizobium meliloti]RVL60285.1 hypothetical protein CN138_35260 [Sinorhizobium meliloti]RVL70647.1 hypothetical protein CN140_35210 [Sinorhizobium meliloti]RVN34685.1 hypothetical protein CN113_34825 [Sinorhizobium meliloti]
MANTPQIVQLLRVICFRYIFEIVDDEGQIRAYVASYMYRKADKLIVLHRGAGVGIDICPWISRTVIPRAYIEMILSSKSGNRR